MKGHLEKGTTLHVKLDMAWHLEKDARHLEKVALFPNTLKKELMQRIVQREIAKGNAT